MNDEENQDEAQDVEIMPTDIVFDCPHCGHNLVVDYRAAGLQVPCPSCGSIIQAPIPEGMHLEDLDCDPGELLQQLLQTRRMLVKAESAAQQMGDKIASMMELIADYRKTLLAVKARVETLQEAADLANATRQDVIDLIASVGSK
ncbi:MAG: hypothetical protein RR133_04875 [Kiritimatiellia bacterium]